tara:strand:+ start:4485 stop:4859 length:375 start_codon:yes stop_codon:yes gene_type:complete
MKNLFLLVSFALTTIAVNAQVTACSVDFIVTPLNWEEDVFQYGMDMVVDGITLEAIKPWDTKAIFNPINLRSGDTQYIINAIQNDVIVDQYTITAVKTGEGCLIEFTPNVNVGEKTKIEILARL